MRAVRNRLFCSLVVHAKVNQGAPWYYEEPKPAASEISGRVAFWKGVGISG